MFRLTCSKTYKGGLLLRITAKKLRFLMFYGPTFFSFPKLLAPVVRKVYNAIQRIAIGFPNTYPLDSDLSGGLGTGWFSPN